MAPKLTAEQRHALQIQQGGPISVESEDGTYILMSIDFFRAVMGVGADADFDVSIAAVRAGMEDVRAGRTRPLKDALDDLGARHGVSR